MRKMLLKCPFNLLRTPLTSTLRSISYVQGQQIDKTREYFYFVNHEGMLFLDDARMKNFTSCFKDKKFLQFFFTRLKFNESGRYTEDFPYLSLCGREHNYIRCDDLPIVFTHILEPKEGKELISYALAGDLLTVPFEPERIFMSASGKVYHPSLERHGRIGLVASKLAIELSKLIEYDEGSEMPKRFRWKGRTYDLETDWVKDVVVPGPL